MALNDPQWGKKNNDGPPDLDEIWRKFNEKLRGLFGGKRGGGSAGGSGTNTPNMKQLGGGAGMIALIVLGVWLASGFYIVQEGRRGVELTFGKYRGSTTTPGPRWHWPYPIESVEVVDVSQNRTVTIGYRGLKQKQPQESLMLTDDENIVDVQFSVQFLVKSPEDFLFKNKTLPDDSVRQAAETAIRQVVGKSKMDFVLQTGRDDIANSTRLLMQQILDRYESGIRIDRVNMQSIQPPEQVQAAFDDAVKAGQDLERQKNEGQAYANDVIPRARGNASRLIEEANGYRQRVVANAEGEASRFIQVLAEYEKAPAVTRERIYLDSMQQMLSNTSKVMIDQKSGGNNLLYLPLDKLMQVSGAATDVSSPSVTSTPSSTIPDTTRPRDTRSRDREGR
ncbi:MAG: FtsH protease activity modulator HflK [Burkholderiales bacterium]